MESSKIIINIILLFFLLASPSNAIDSITPNQSLKDDMGDTLVSHSGKFDLAFFDIGVKGRYLGIRYRNSAKNSIIWVANRNIPLNDTSGVLTLTPQGALILESNTTTSPPRKIWSSNVTTSSSGPINPVARLLDTGNLVVGNSNSRLEFEGDDYLWESFYYPGNTFMPSMKFGKNLVTDLDIYLSSWKIDNKDPSEGSYTNKLDPTGYPQIFLRNEDRIMFRSGPWNGERFSGMPSLKRNEIYTFEFVNSAKGIYYTYNLIDSNNVVSKMVLNDQGKLQRWTINDQGDWHLYLTAQTDDCDLFNRCGPNGCCNINDSPACGCFYGFEPKKPISWNVGYWGDGCVRRVDLECEKDGFKRVSRVKLPDTRNVVYHQDLSLRECERLCHANCNCTAYANSDIRNGGSGCLMWFDELNDTRVYGGDEGQDFYVRLAASELDNGATRTKVAIIVVPVLSVGAILLLCLILYRRKQKKLKRSGMIHSTLEPGNDQSSGAQSEENDLELPLIDYADIKKATHNFSLENKLGEGGFGLVYKGMLDDGQEIAVKRLSKFSKQGIDEFKNEISCIAKLQHRNLVKLLGYCIQEEGKMLIYEYMINKSLDLFIFDQTKSMELDWEKRLVIIHGIARGLMYLHHDSRLRIIHRDLKASNVLLDHNLNPKISDFGMARIFGGDESDQANTNRIVGTYGYMAPEYAVDGYFSVKSDVFSFGVLVLEIVSGKKNRGFNHPGHDLNLLGHAWRLHNEGRSSELLDSSTTISTNLLDQVLRVIHVGLLCVQQSPDYRPSMSMVILMLGSTTALSNPKEPGFFTERNFVDPSLLTSSMLDASVNEMSVTFMEAR